MKEYILESEFFDPFIFSLILAKLSSGKLYP